MSRPEFPVGCVLPVGAIWRINAMQADYDRDPEAYERRERRREEERQDELRQEEEERWRQEGSD